MEKDGKDLFVVILLGFFLMLFMVSFIVIIVVIHRKRQVQNQQKILNLKAEYEKTILNVELEIQEETLGYVGRELHDNIGQLLSLTKLNLSSSKPEKIQEGRHLIGMVIKEVRALSKTLNLDWVEGISLGEYFQKELNKLDQIGFCKTQFKVEGQEIKLIKEKKLVLIRVFQECLNNAVKHSEAQLILVSMVNTSDCLELTFKDDGNGFDLSVPSSGLGLLNLSKRMETIGGKMVIQTKRGTGTEIKLTLPLSIA
ncbi:hypothetical protein P872_01870 [Rhodonellum psychrophilum GCM71 = DSM 17998]|uniref:histidine kinase n=2 Tax=Rhodonellum TaxID=336827 RepID=U5C4E3_9BACT|nr:MULTISPECIES: ATP-binding protein [Rhodonellum]ERM83786.1 hypothetical protein P872_01870 [Rhodonellum psychrophilum GCM71 = DSM 17998]SDY65210.1 Histidine kinase [Rhodonellum ikkaensis]